MNLKKYTKFIIILIAFILIAVFVVYYLSNNKKTSAPVKNAVETMTEQDKASLHLSHFGKYEVVARDNNGKVTSYKFVGLEKPKPLKLDLMTTEDMKNLGITGDSNAGNYKIQVLQRDANGKVLSYHIVGKDSDIVTEY